jgi:hypothetical protein
MTKAGRRRRGRVRPGRPPGSIVRLRKDPQRFPMAVAYAAQMFGLGPRVAAFLALTIIESEEPITIESIKDALFVVSSEYKGSVSLENRAASLARKLELTLSRLRGRDCDWLIYSVCALTALVHSTASQNEKGVETAIEMLKGAGWHDVLARFYWRVAAALKSNFPEFQNRLSAAALQLLSNQLKQNGF